MRIAARPKRKLMMTQTQRAVPVKVKRPPIMVPGHNADAARPKARPGESGMAL